MRWRSVIQIRNCILRLFWQCAGLVGVPDNVITECFDGAVGTQLQLEAEQLTKVISPSFVPTIVYNWVRIAWMIIVYAYAHAYNTASVPFPEIQPEAPEPFIEELFRHRVQPNRKRSPGMPILRYHDPLIRTF